MAEYPLRKLDQREYAARIQRNNCSSRCFICEVVNGTNLNEDIVYRDEVCIAFFPRWPRLLGYTLLSPLEHRTAVVGDFREEEYLELQRRIHRVGRAITAVVPTERLYVLSFGSNQGVEHVHWHLAPLPAGVPFDQQQGVAVGRDEYLDIPLEDRVALAARIRAEVRR